MFKVTLCCVLTRRCLSLVFTDDNCRLGDYKKLKNKIVDLHGQRYLAPGDRGDYRDDMVVRRRLVDMMFKRFDADGNGRVDSSELSQVTKQQQQQTNKNKKNNDQRRRDEKHSFPFVLSIWHRQKSHLPNRIQKQWGNNSR